METARFFENFIDFLNKFVKVELRDLNPGIGTTSLDTWHDFVFAGQKDPPFQNPETAKRKESVGEESFEVCPESLHEIMTKDDVRVGEG